MDKSEKKEVGEEWKVFKEINFSSAKEASVMKLDMEEEMVEDGVE